MAGIYVWVRTVRSLQFFLPSLDVTLDPFPVYADLCLEIIEMLSENDQISFDEFSDICKERIGENHMEAVFQNAREHEKRLARIKLLAYSLLFAGLQQRTKDLEKASRAEVLLSRLYKYFGSVFKLLFQLDVGKRLADRDIIQAIGNGQGFEFLDGFFEGTIKQRHGNSNQHGVRPLSLMVPVMLDKANGFSLPYLCNEIRKHLIKDPYHIDEFSSDKPVPVFSTARRTTLAHNSRRVVHLHYISKMEVLRKDEFANVHLRICNDKAKASYVIAPLRCETVFLDSLMFCKWILLGAVRGVVIVQNCHGIRISACCDQVIIQNCRNLEIHSMSLKKPIIYNSFNITFAPFNTVYEEQMEFLHENGQSFDSNDTLKEPINFGEGSWHLMEPSRFICQHSPLHTTDKNFDILLNSLPEIYRLAHIRNSVEGQHWISVENCRINDVVSHSDLLYLKSKIDKKQEDEEKTLQ